MITAKCNSYGYIIYKDGVEIYLAGNCIIESTTVVDYYSPLKVPEAQLGAWTAQTAQEIAEEQGYKFDGRVRFDAIHGMAKERGVLLPLE